MKRVFLSLIILLSAFAGETQAQKLPKVKLKDIAGKAAVAAASAISSAKDFVEEATGKDLDGDGKVGKGE